MSVGAWSDELVTRWIGEADRETLQKWEASIMARLFTQIPDKTGRELFVGHVLHDARWQILDAYSEKVPAPRKGGKIVKRAWLVYERGVELPKEKK